MDVPQLMKAMAAYATSSGLVTAFDEPPPNLETADLPALVLFWDGEEATTITPDMDGDMWDVTIRGRLYGAAKEGDTPQEFAAVSGLITPLVAAFNKHRVPNLFLPGLTGTVDRLRVVRVLGSLEVGYAAQDYYGADLFWNAKFHTYYGDD